MKKIALLTATLAIAACMVPTIAGAAPSTDGATAALAAETQVAQACPGYVDEDNDGVCDNRAALNENRFARSGYVDEDGDGVCDNRGVLNSGCPTCPGYVDEDGDGVCDNRQSNRGNQQGACGNGACCERNGAGGGNGRCGR